MTPPQPTRPNTHHWPLYIYPATMAAAIALTAIWPAFHFDFIGQHIAGAALFLIGVGVGISAILHFLHIGTTIAPTGRAKVLATTGIYRFTRNPMYVGAVLAFFGGAVFSGNGWLLMLTPLMALALYHLAIAREEAWLSVKFGDEFRAYCARTRRWL